MTFQSCPLLCPFPNSVCVAVCRWWEAVSGGVPGLFFWWNTQWRRTWEAFSYHWLGQHQVSSLYWHSPISQRLWIIVLACSSSAKPPRGCRDATCLAKLCKISISAWIVSPRDGHYDSLSLGVCFQTLFFSATLSLWHLKWCLVLLLRAFQWLFSFSTSSKSFTVLQKVTVWMSVSVVLSSYFTHNKLKWFVVLSLRDYSVSPALGLCLLCLPSKISPGAVIALAVKRNVSPSLQGGI